MFLWSLRQGGEDPGAGGDETALAYRGRDVVEFVEHDLTLH